LVDQPARISRVPGSLGFAWTSKYLEIGLALKECWTKKSFTIPESWKGEDRTSAASR
jgi:hypothetical protein